MMNKKAQAIQVGGVIGVIIALLLFGALFFYVIPQLTPPAELRINLQSSQIVKPENGVLFYRITNNKDKPLENIVLGNYIVDRETDSKVIDNEIKRLEGNSDYSGKYIINTRSLSKGKYTVKTILNYTYEGENKMEELTLLFEIF